MISDCLPAELKSKGERERKRREWNRGLKAGYTHTVYCVLGNEVDRTEAYCSTEWLLLSGNESATTNSLLLVVHRCGVNVCVCVYVYRRRSFGSCGGLKRVERADHHHHHPQHQQHQQQADQMDG